LHYPGIGCLQRAQVLTHCTCWAEFGKIRVKYRAHPNRQYRER